VLARCRSTKNGLLASVTSRRVVLCVIIFCLPGSPGAVPWDKGFSWSDFNYAPVVTIALALGVWIAWEASAKRTFKGPVRTLDEPDVGTSDDPALMPAN
jgi:hypothetical protein